MTEKNVYQVADWKGQSGERWGAYQARLDAMMAVFGQAAIEAAAPVTGERVLDVGCGAGASSLDLADRVGAGGHVLGVDISEPLISRARVRRERCEHPGHGVARGRIQELDVGRLRGHGEDHGGDDLARFERRPAGAGEEVGGEMPPRRVHRRAEREAGGGGQSPATFVADALRGLRLPLEGLAEDLFADAVYWGHLAEVLARRAVALASGPAPGVAVFSYGSPLRSG